MREVNLLVVFQGMGVCVCVREVILLVFEAIGGGVCEKS